MKAKALFVIIVSVFFVCKAGNAQEAWEMINDFEGEGLKKGGVFTLPALEDQSGNIWFVTNSGNVYKRENNTSVLTMDLGLIGTVLWMIKLASIPMIKLI